MNWRVLGSLVAGAAAVVALSFALLPFEVPRGWVGYTPLTQPPPVVTHCDAAVASAWNDPPRVQVLSARPIVIPTATAGSVELTVSERH
jgi:hypothetical protein